jgi:hypothetical protein
MSNTEPVVDSALIVLPIADHTYVNPDLSKPFHEQLRNDVEAELRASAANMVAYDTAYVRCMRLLDENSEHTTKPMLGQLANVVYRYTDPTTNFGDVMKFDPLTAVWAGHLFICCQQKVSWLFFDV